MPPDQLAGLAMKPLFVEPAPRQRPGLQGWIRRLLILLACLWLAVGVLLPLAEVFEKATTLEVQVAIDEPTEEQKTLDPFRGEIRVAGYSILLMEEAGQGVLYLNNRRIDPVDVSDDHLQVRISDTRFEQVVITSAIPPGQTERMPIKPVKIERHSGGYWLIDSHPFPLGDAVRTVTRFIGLANFMYYFGIHDLTQKQFVGAFFLILLAGFLLVRMLIDFVREKPATLRTWYLPAAVMLLLAAQIAASGQLIYHHSGQTNLAQSTWNSLLVAFTTTLVAVVLAFIYAYGLTRTRMVGKMLFRVIAMLPLFAPTMLYGLSLVYLFGNQGLVTTGFFGKVSWLAWDINLYGFTGIVLAEIAFTFPPAMMILSVALAHTDARLYEASSSLGAGRIRTFFMVTLPGVKYGLLSAIFVCFTLSFTDFGAPKIVGGHFNVLAVDIYKQVVGQQNFGLGATVSLILLAPTLLAFVADRIVQRRSHAALTARSVPLTPGSLPWRDRLYTVLCGLIAAAILAILFTAGIGSFVKIWPYGFSHPEIYPELWTLSHYRFEGVGGGGFKAFLTSLRMAGYTALFGTIITFISAYLIEKTRDAQKLRQSAYLLSIVPLALPGLVIGIAYVFFFNKPTFSLPFIDLQIANPFTFIYGTMAILVLSNIVHFYTVSFLTATTALRQLDKEFEIVSESLAVPFYRTFFRVTVPVCFPAIVEIAAYYFVSAMATVSAVIFLYNSHLPLASVAVVNMDDAGDTAAAAAMCMLIVAVNILVRLGAEGVCWLFAGKTRQWRQK
ncbi:putative 2-aminoethylphosphonate ABC transporter permease subunit [Pelovirga terrestris]|nr:putative 2-aminoethylphosphonate ABC transporter permease subunit [Pelovirga terrestris]